MLKRNISLFIFLLTIMTHFTARTTALPLKEKMIINNINIDKIENLMIIAHPDDESLWGGNHLLAGKYLVVCITCGNNPKRAKEFAAAMQATDDDYIMLEYPDIVFHKRSRWLKERKKIISDLTAIITAKNWHLIVTHNPSGEYGHIHHIITSKIVTNIYKDQMLTNTTLYYFGNYYRPKELVSQTINLPSLNEQKIVAKQALLKNYPSQDKIIKHFEHMIKYENWINAKDWRTTNAEKTKTRLY